MVSMSEFLSGFEHHGEPVIQQGAINPSRQREGLKPVGTFGLDGGSSSLELDPNDFAFAGPEIFARLLQSAEMDGGFLSDVSQNAILAGETEGLMRLLGSQNRDRRRAADAAGLDPIFTERQEIDAGYDMLSKILGHRAKLRGELEERQFGAQEAFANMLAETDVAEKTFRVNTQAALTGAEIGAEGAIAGGKAQASGSRTGGLLSGIGSIVGASIMGGI